MATDLKTHNDHPVNLLRNHYAPQHPITSSVYTTAAGALEGYEQVNHVTFAALHNEALASVREAFDVAASAPRGSGEREEGLEDLYRAVGDLLGLND